MEDPGIIGFCYEDEEPSREAYNDVQYALRCWNVEYDPNNPNITGVPIFIMAAKRVRLNIGKNIAKNARKTVHK